MNFTPKVSVIVASYNRAQFLPETVESILQQRFTEYELIVVDDGSSDDTREILQRYGDRVRYFYQKNRGPSAARNLGAIMARAPWIAIQDSDDVCAPDYLKTLYEYAQGHSECGLIFADGAYLKGKEHNRETIIPTKKSQRLARDGVQLLDLFEKSIVRLQASLISKKCYDEIGGHDESLLISMDLDLTFRIVMRYPVAYLDQVVFYYRKHEGNIGANQELRLLENIKVIEKLVSNFPEAKKILGPGRVGRRLAYRYYRLAKNRWKEGRKQAARAALKEAIALNPLALKYRLYDMRWA